MRAQRGSTLITALVCAFIVGIISMSLISLSQAGTYLTAHRRDQQVAFDIADAGIQHAFRSLTDNPNYSGQTAVPFGSGNFTTTISPGPIAGYDTITSTGTVTGAVGMTSTRTVTAVVEMGQQPAILNYGLIAKGPIQLSGGSSVTSAPKAHVGDVFSDSWISMSGGSKIDGTLGAAGKIQTSGSAGATGTVTKYAKPVDFPAITPPNMEQIAAGYGTTEGDVVASGVPVHVQGIIDGNINISGGGELIIDGPVYVTGNVNISGSSYGGGQGSFMAVEGDVNFSGSSALNNVDPNFTLVALATDHTAMVLSGGASMTGCLFVPNGNLDVSGSANIFGCVAADTVNLSGSININRNTNLQWPYSLSKPMLAYWQD